MIIQLCVANIMPLHKKPSTTVSRVAVKQGPLFCEAAQSSSMNVQKQCMVKAVLLKQCIILANLAWFCSIVSLCGSNHTTVLGC